MEKKRASVITFSGKVLALNLGEASSCKKPVIRNKLKSKNLDAGKTIWFRME
jgi:hypothetical protein